MLGLVSRNAFVCNYYQMQNVHVEYFILESEREILTNMPDYFDYRRLLLEANEEKMSATCQSHTFITFSIQKVSLKCHIQVQPCDKSSFLL